jgi:hypothetical protein
MVERACVDRLPSVESTLTIYVVDWLTLGVNFITFLPGNPDTMLAYTRTNVYDDPEHITHVPEWSATAHINES